MIMDWRPFVVQSVRGQPPRGIHTPGGVADRMRAAAFAELQAREAFRWGAVRFTDAPEELRKLWLEFADVEHRHLGWLLGRMAELGYDPAERPVHDQLWQSLQSCTSAREFALYIASAEDRGKLAGLRFEEQLRESDPVTAEIFGKIAAEEVEHIETAYRFYPG